ncbi:uncharacterized protein LOC143147668 isoform X2 [Ptiloglossa arizonensis]|uniref:uncharacterized protein LOC143147668 isoform X2 n=1 Tax=Ptiloglossa arizonensis TaxID=3350558 RepID=UPI003F9EEA1E
MPVRKGKSRDDRFFAKRERGARAKGYKPGTPSSKSNGARVASTCYNVGNFRNHGAAERYQIEAVAAIGKHERHWPLCSGPISVLRSHHFRSIRLKTTIVGRQLRRRTSQYRSRGAFEIKKTWNCIIAAMTSTRCILYRGGSNLREETLNTRVIKTYLIILGQYLQQTDRRRKIMLTVIIGTTVSLLIPMLIQFTTSLNDKNMDAVLEIVPVIFTNLVTILKISNIDINRKQFKELYNLMSQEWKSLKIKEEIRILDTVTERGSKVAYYYRTALLTSLVFFTLLPLVSPFLDIVLPLNETRLREQVFRLNYLVDGDEYFYPIYFHSIWSSIVSVITIVSVDSVYMVITHHACGLFAICGNRIQRLTQNTNSIANDVANQRNIYLQLKDCTIVHKRAIQFYELIDKINRNSFLLQIGMCMISISLTAVQVQLPMVPNPNENAKSVLHDADKVRYTVYNKCGRIVRYEHRELWNDF